MAGTSRSSPKALVSAVISDEAVTPEQKNKGNRLIFMEDEWNTIYTTKRTSEMSRLSMLREGHNLLHQGPGGNTYTDQKRGDQTTELRCNVRQDDKKRKEKKYVTGK
jgi:hypothetical protein